MQSASQTFAMKDSSLQGEWLCNHGKIWGLKQIAKVQNFFELSSLTFKTPHKLYTLFCNSSCFSTERLFQYRK